VSLLQRRFIWEMTVNYEQDKIENVVLVA